MSSPVPTFGLRGCPRCSSRAGGITNPTWKFAHNTSAKRERNCYFWVPGCRHAEGFSDPARIYDDPAEWAKVEGAWLERSAQLFEEMTAKMTLSQRDQWRALIESRHYVAGTTREMTLE